MANVCPICKQPVAPPAEGSEPAEPSHYPFCSERCKLIDLGRWLDGRYQIPVVQDDLDETNHSLPEPP